MAAQLSSVLKTIDCSTVYTAQSGVLRLERTIARTSQGELIAADTALHAVMIGRWLAGLLVSYRFTGPLEPLEDALADAGNLQRAAGVFVALELAQYGKGAPNRYKAGHWSQLTADLPALIEKTATKLIAAYDGFGLAGFNAEGLDQQLNRAIDARATFVVAPPFNKGRHDGLVRWVESHTQWDKPPAPVGDGVNLAAVVARLRSAKLPHLIVSGERLADVEPRALVQGAGGRESWIYAEPGAARLTRVHDGGKPFKYRPLELDKITAKSRVDIVKTDGGRAMYIRSIYLKKTISPVMGQWNYFVYIDGMLAGVLVYSPAKFAPKPDAIYLLSDVSVSREARVSKLIARLASNKTILDDIAARTLSRVSYVVTTAFSDHPASMKYRGLFELLSRKDAEGGFQLQYGGEARPETPQQAFAWWWSNHVQKPEGHAGRGGGRGRR